MLFKKTLLQVDKFYIGLVVSVNGDAPRLYHSGSDVYLAEEMFVRDPHQRTVQENASQVHCRQ
jgi:hypothetical protein